jgi:hypothetical protein
MVVNKYGARLYKGLEDTERAHLERVAERIAETQGETFLRTLKAEWENHNKSITMIRDILMVRRDAAGRRQGGAGSGHRCCALCAGGTSADGGAPPACLLRRPRLRPPSPAHAPPPAAPSRPAQYMDRIFVRQTNKKPVHQLGLDLWRDVVVRDRRIRERLLGMLLDVATRERAGELVDRGLARSMTMMLVDLGPQVYCEDFERPFLACTADFYQVRLGSEGRATGAARTAGDVGALCCRGCALCAAAAERRALPGAERLELPAQSLLS